MQKDDVIYRQQAIDAVENGCQEWKGIFQRCEANIKNLPSTQPEQRWIPCSERLPEEKDAGILKKLGTEKRSGYVIVTVEVKGERMTSTACTHDGKWNWEMKYAFPDYKVVAWMPLPEPYGGDQNG